MNVLAAQQRHGDGAPRTRRRSCSRTGSAATRTCGGSSRRRSRTTTASCCSTTSAPAARTSPPTTRSATTRSTATPTDVVEICARARPRADVVFVGHSVSAMIGVLAARARARAASASSCSSARRRATSTTRATRGGFSRADIDELLESLDSNFLGWSSAMAPGDHGQPRPARARRGADEQLLPHRPGRSPAQFARVTFLSDNRADLAARDGADAGPAVRATTRSPRPRSASTCTARSRARRSCCSRRRATARTSARPSETIAGDPGVPVTAVAPARGERRGPYEHAPCGYLSTEPDGTIVARQPDVPATGRGYAREELVGVRRFQDLLTVGGRIYHETHYAPLLRMQGAVREIALEIVRADGRRLPVLVNSVLKRDADGEPLLIRTTVFDATDRQRYERELLAARDRERAARERVERLQRLDRGARRRARHRRRSARAVDRGARRRRSAPTAPASPSATPGAARSRVAAPARRRRAARRPPGAASTRGRGAARCTALHGRRRPGVLCWMLDAPRAFDAGRARAAEACAGQAALALERARLYEQERDVAHVLQQSMLAGAPPRDPRFEVATLYQPGRRAARGRRRLARRVHAAGRPASGSSSATSSAAGSARRARWASCAAPCARSRAPGSARASVLGAPRHVRRAGRGRALRDARLRRGRPRRRATCCSPAAGHLPPLLARPRRRAGLFMDGRSPPLGVAAPGVARAQARVALAPGRAACCSTPTAWSSAAARRSTTASSGCWPP